MNNIWFLVLLCKLWNGIFLYNSINLFSGLNYFFPLAYFELSSYFSGSVMCSDDKCLFFRVRIIVAVMSKAIEKGLFVSYFHTTVYH